MAFGNPVSNVEVHMNNYYGRSFSFPAKSRQA